MALHAISLLTQRRLIDDIERRRTDTHLVVLPPPCPPTIQPVDFGHPDALIGRALDEARAFLDGGGEERPAIRMHMHRHRPAPSSTRGSRLDAAPDGVI